MGILQGLVSARFNIFALTGAAVAGPSAFQSGHPVLGWTVVAASALNVAAIGHACWEEYRSTHARRKPRPYNILDI